MIIVRVHFRASTDIEEGESEDNIDKADKTDKAGRIRTEVAERE